MSNSKSDDKTGTDSFSHEEQNYSNYDLFIFALTIISLVVLVILALPGVSESVKSVAFILDTVICLFFLGDFFRSLYRAPRKRTYLKWGWVDFLGSLPALPILRIFRVARLVRIGRVMRRIGLREVWHVYKERRPDPRLAVYVRVQLPFLCHISTKSCVCMDRNLFSK